MPVLSLRFSVIRSEVLKIILNLTTHSAAWPNALADRKKTFHQLSDSIWMDQTTEDDSARECLCLQLGVLFNILQKAKEEAKQRLVDTCECLKIRIRDVFTHIDHESSSLSIFANLFSIREMRNNMYLSSARRSSRSTRQAFRRARWHA